jgi:hypothetical protein
MGVGGLVLGVKTEIVCNRVQRGYTMVIDSSSFTSGGINSPSICSAASSCDTNQKEHQYFERVGITSFRRYWYRFVWRQVRHRQTGLIVHCQVQVESLAVISHCDQPHSLAGRFTATDPRFNAVG